MYKRSIDGWAKHWDFILLDTIVLQLSFIIAYWVRYQAFYDYSRRNAYRTSSFVLLLLSIVVAILFHTMHNVLSRGLWAEIRQTVIQCGLVFAGIVIILFSAKDSNHVSRLVLYIAMGLYAVLGLVTRLGYKRVLLKLKQGSPKREMLLVGDERGIKRALEAFNHHPEEGVNIKSIVRVDRDSHSDEKGIELANAAEYIRNEWIDEVYIACSDASLIPSKLISQCHEMAVTVHQQMMMADASDSLDNVWVEKIAKQPVLTTSVNIPRPRQIIFKRCVDIISGLLLSILAILTLIIAGAVIKIVSPGPVLLKLERIGRNGKKFNMYMIRTMYMDAANREPGFRVIKGIGNFLRRWSLDELPKGFNVLAGTMSLVGTRPPSTVEWEGYKYHHRARLACKPGITGLFTVIGGRDADFETATRIDTYYITNWSIGLDLRILFTPTTLQKRYASRQSGRNDQNERSKR